MATSDRTILVTGATGHQGNAVAHHLLKRGKFHVRALVRDEHKHSAIALKRLGAELFIGDLDQQSSIEHALQGVYGVFSMQGLNDGIEAEIREGKALVDVAKALGIGHFVYSSVGSAERKTGVPHFDSKFQIEEYVRASGLPYTILRPVFFFYNYDAMRSRSVGSAESIVETGTLSQPLSPDTKLQQLSEEDYGEMVSEVFTRFTDFANREIEVASGEMTMPEVAAAFTRVLGKNVAYQQIPFEAFEQQAGAEMTTMYRWFESVGYGADLAQLKRDLPAPTDFESYLCEHDWVKQVL